MQVDRAIAEEELKDLWKENQDYVTRLRWTVAHRGGGNPAPLPYLLTATTNQDNKSTYKSFKSPPSIS